MILTAHPVARLWLRTCCTVALLLAVPLLFPRLRRALDPQEERLDLARAAERQQRASGERVVLPSGEVRRAVVYTPVLPSDVSERRMDRGLWWWSALLVALTLLSTVRRTVGLNRRNAAADPRPAKKRERPL